MFGLFCNYNKCNHSKVYIMSTFTLVSELFCQPANFCPAGMLLKRSYFEATSREEVVELYSKQCVVGGEMLLQEKNFILGAKDNDSQHIQSKGMTTVLKMYVN